MEGGERVEVGMGEGGEGVGEKGRVEGRRHLILEGGGLKGHAAGRVGSCLALYDK